MKRFVLRALALAPLLFLFGVLAGPIKSVQAKLITIDVNGTVDFVSPALAPPLAIGQSYTVSYTFESTTPARAGSTAMQAAFDALTMVTINVGPYTASAAGVNLAEIQIDANLPANPDRYFLITFAPTLSGMPLNGNTLVAGGYVLRDSTKTAFATALNLPEKLDLSDFDSSSMFLDFTNSAGDFLTVTGSINSIVSDVPEPGSLAIFLVGLAGLGFDRGAYGDASGCRLIFASGASFGLRLPELGGPLAPFSSTEAAPETSPS